MGFLQVLYRYCPSGSTIMEQLFSTNFLVPVSVLARSRKAVIKFPLWVFGITCGLEFPATMAPSGFGTVSLHLLGRIIGTPFLGGIFLTYAVGCLLGWFWLRQIDKEFF